MSRRSPGLRRLAYYRAHFLETVRPGGVVGLKCGKERKMLGTHILMARHTNTFRAMKPGLAEAVDHRGLPATGVRLLSAP